MNVDQILNFGLGIGAIFAMALQKYKNAYMLFAALLAWVILSNFVRGDASNRKESFNVKDGKESKSDGDLMGTHY